MPLLSSADVSNASSAVDIAAPGVVIGALTSFFASIVSAKVLTVGAVGALALVIST
ncbi:MAG: hypothetical protein L6V78_06620 [Clostridium sp.]|nr:MAG: hypothetical protein L6V78_06620 [Clostridium sp.]